jgi:hypothetical protein
MDWTRFRSVAVLATAVLLAACGGTASPNPSTGAAVGSSVEATSAPVASQGAVSSQAAGAAPSVDISSAAQGLSNLSSYKVTTMNTKGSEVSTVTIVTIRRPTPATSFAEAGGATNFRYVVIGTDVWVDQGTGTYVKNPPGMTAATIEALSTAFDPGAILTAIGKSVALAAFQNKGVEQKNGVSALHLHADHSTQVPAGESPLPEGGTADVWVATDGNYVVAIEAAGLSTDSSSLSSFQMEVTNINDSSLTVTPPA